MMQRRLRLSQSLGPLVRRLLLELEDRDEQTLVVGLVDNLILTLNVATSDLTLSSRRKVDYDSKSNVFASSKCQKIVAGLFIRLVKPHLAHLVSGELRSVKEHEWMLLESVFR